MEYALRFNFETTNNAAEHKAMLAGLELVLSLGVQQILVRGDSKLIMDQIKGDCGIKSESLLKYHAKATTLAKKFAHIVFEHIPREETKKQPGARGLENYHYQILKRGTIAQQPCGGEENTTSKPQILCVAGTPISRILGSKIQRSFIDQRFNGVKNRTGWCGLPPPIFPQPPTTASGEALLPPPRSAPYLQGVGPPLGREKT
ncbi:hypothetical protein LIER_14736 [Lithospermum erythrorhizon]|uniref:RNase H type-1 domain-containing protein n=1 Tax=Lithospermum erythrorhizon TaxID=34254 RepID=A0AAV3Q1S3_LITER